ncbi:hypothetical protein PIB30_041488 [Stylosanthes scabra]|uniref:Uncharacterized protein n=1 Tax=Stylosanthes scabra TaxID=79078 RepID=A0ABU6TEJ9_9FABA|nr:hypothetical protein [Stylosanthes scabra]
MAMSYDLLSKLDESSESQSSYNIKVRVLKKWSIAQSEDKYQKPMLEMVLMDSERDTQMKLVNDINFPKTIFNFVPNEAILSHGNAQSHLIDVMGLLTGKGNTIEFMRNRKTCIYVVLELDDMKGNGKVRCTLWEEFATQIVKHIEEQPTSEYVIIMQFGVMGVSNTNYNTILLINPDLDVAKEFRQSVMMSNIPVSSMLLHISTEPPYSLQEDLLHNCVYKSVSQLNDSLENGNFATLGTVMDIDAKNGWWYKSCKYSINLKVADETETASFVVYDKEATKFLGLSASDLRVAQLTRGGIKEDYPSKIGGFLNKRFIFKVSVKLEDMNAFQPCKIVVLKLCADPPMIAAFIEHHKIFEQHVPLEMSELLSLTTQSEVASKNESNTNSAYLNTGGGGDTLCTPKRALFSREFSKDLADEYLNSTEHSSSKSRKIVMEKEVIPAEEDVA